ncbi:MAG: hypothetical protein ABSC23_15005 [Bryobacteraceae bacterium]|jgi:hypothetical protein
MESNGGNGVSVSLGWGDSGNLGVVFTIPSSTFIEMADGSRVPGIVMSPELARELAYVFLLHAEQLTNRSVPLPPRPDKLGG